MLRWARCRGFCSWRPGGLGVRRMPSAEEPRVHENATDRLLLRLLGTQFPRSDRAQLFDALDLVAPTHVGQRRVR